MLHTGTGVCLARPTKGDQVVWPADEPDMPALFGEITSATKHGSVVEVAWSSGPDAVPIKHEHLRSMLTFIDGDEFNFWLY